MSSKKIKLSEEFLDNWRQNHPIALKEVVVYPNRAATELGLNAKYEDFVDWWRQSQIDDAYERAIYSRAGFAPLETAEDTASYIDDPQIYADTITHRHNSGFYLDHPAVLQSDSALYKQRFHPIAGWSCINSNTNYFGPQYANMNNINFAKRHFGFIPVDKHQMQKGDIIQLQRGFMYPDNDYQRPFHAVMFDSYDENGNANVIDQHGQWGYVTPGRLTYDLEFDGKGINVKNAYRFVGSNADLKKAWDEYLNFTSKGK